MDLSWFCVTYLLNELNFKSIKCTFLGIKLCENETNFEYLHFGMINCILLNHDVKWIDLNVLIWKTITVPSNFLFNLIVHREQKSLIEYFFFGKNKMIFCDVGWKHARKIFPWKTGCILIIYTYNYCKQKRAQSETVW